MQQPSYSDARADTAIPIKQKYTMSEKLQNKKEKQDCKLKRRMHRRQTLQLLAQQDNHFLKESITMAEDERTAMAKADTKEVRQSTIDKAHDQSNLKPTQASPNLHKMPRTEFARHSRGQPHNS